MEFFLKWLVFASISIAVTISPGPAFAFTVRNAVAHGRRAGLISSIGLGLGVTILVLLVMTGFAILVSKSLILFNLIRYCGAAYLIFIGMKALRTKKHPVNEKGETSAPAYRPISDVRALMLGVATNISNPKGIVYFTAIFAQFITPDMTIAQKICYGATSAGVEIIWFSFVTYILTNRRVRKKFMSFSHWIERVCGGLMILIGAKLAFTRVLAR